MTKLINALKMAYLAFAEEMEWDYSVRFSDGRTFSRKGMKVEIRHDS